MKPSNLICSYILLCCSTALADTHYVDINSTNSVSPYTSWGTAATSIQDAIDEAVAGETVLAMNRTYLISTEIRVTNDMILSGFIGQMVACDSEQQLQYENFYSRAVRHAGRSAEGIEA